MAPCPVEVRGPREATGGAGGGAAGSAGAILDASNRDSPPDAPRLDASADTNKPPDTSPPPDAPPDASIGNSFCSMAPHTFCSDFDDSNSLAQWSTQFVGRGGSLSLSTVQRTSPPQSLFVRTVTTDAGGSSQATLHKNLTGTVTSRAHLAFDLYSGQFAASGNSNAVTFGIGTTNLTLALTQGAQISCRLTPFGSGVTGASIACPATFSANTWTHFEIDLTPAGTSISVGIAMGPAFVTGSFQATNFAGAAIFEIGSYPGSPQGFWDGYFDNVTVDLQ